MPGAVSGLHIESKLWGSLKALGLSQKPCVLTQTVHLISSNIQVCQSTFPSPSFLFNKKDVLFYKVIIYANMYYIVLFYKVMGIKCNHMFIFTCVYIHIYTHTRQRCDV